MSRTYFLSECKEPCGEVCLSPCAMSTCQAWLPGGDQCPTSLAPFRPLRVPPCALCAPGAWLYGIGEPQTPLPARNELQMASSRVPLWLWRKAIVGRQQEACGRVQVSPCLLPLQSSGLYTANVIAFALQPYGEL
ncbi:unnamed protein product [Cladocopium goreaui]|uniref:Uncharacterized protein n=1 Tax=Cladocopium goreaui TaxID=2562237 RepID=A0A9P1FUG5_9DINO|nr:unnamed protein product [Cladocopium goreaui]